MQGIVKEIAFDLVLGDGTLLSVLANSVLVAETAGRPASIRTTLVDITDRRRYERELLLARRRAEQLAGVVNASGDAIMLYTPDGTIQTWNRGAERLFGWTAEEAIGRSPRAFLVPADRLEEFDRFHASCVRDARCGSRPCASIARGSASTSPSPPRPTRSGRGRSWPSRPSCATCPSAAGRSRVTGRAERLQAVGTLPGGVAHEVNNQMTAVMGLAEFVLRALGKGHPQAGDVEDMARAAVRAARISKQLLAFSRQQLLDPRLLDLHQIVTELAPSLRGALGSDKELVIAPSPALGRERAR